MKMTRLYTGEDGESHFEDIELPLKELSGGIYHSEDMSAKVAFCEVRGARMDGNHNAPHRQIVAILSGCLQVGIGDGTVRRFVGGDLLLAEDTTGNGHITRTDGEVPLKQVLIRLNESAEKG